MTNKTLQEAAQLALDALESHTYSEESNRCTCCGHRGDCAKSCAVRLATNALRAALALPDEPMARADELLSAFKGAPFVQAQGCLSGEKPPLPAPVERKPLTDEQILVVFRTATNPDKNIALEFGRAIIAADRALRPAAPGATA